MHTSSVHPGYTVDSYTTIVPFVKFLPTISDAPITGDKSGVWSIFTGVGTATIINFAFLSSVSSAVNFRVVFFITRKET